jgi:hypothetical protein
MNHNEPTNQDALTQKETASLIAADKVEGTTVYDAAGEKMGSIHRIMIDKLSGKVDYAVLSFGGFLGIGERYHPLPWGMLTYDEALEGYVVNLSKERLESAPSYAEHELAWQDPRFGSTVTDYYGPFAH